MNMFSKPLRLLLCILISIASFHLNGQEIKYLTHTIQKGDNVKKLSKKYNVSSELLIRLNPELKNEPSLNSIIIIPFNNEDYVLDVPKQELPPKAPEEPMIIAYDSILHEVQPKETLYSLSIKYKMRISRVYELNPHVIGGLKVGQTVLFIKPIYDQIEEGENEEKFTKHIVRRKETLWRISKMYNTDVDIIKQHNSSIEHRGLKVNDTLLIPNIRSNIITRKTVVTQVLKPNTTPLAYTPLSSNDSVNIRGFRDLRHYPHWYRVEAGESLPSIAAKLNIPLVDLLNYNPRITHTGLDIGTILYYKTYDLKQKVDSLNNEKFGIDDSLAELDWQITPMILPHQVPLNKKVKPLKVAIMLPFFTEVNDTLLNPSKRHPKEDIKPTIHRLTKPALHFLYGALHAIEKFNQAGHKFEVRVFDTKDNINVIEQFIYQESLYSYDLIIGPLTTKSTHFLSNRMKSFNIPIVSPFTTKLAENPVQNLIQASVSDRAYQTYLKKYLNHVVYDENIVLYASSKELENARKFSHELQSEMQPNYSKQYDIKVYNYTENKESIKDNILSYLAFSRRNINVVFDRSNSILNHQIINNLSYKSDSTSNIFVTNFRDVEGFENKIDEIDYLPRNASRIFTSKNIQYNLPETRDFLQHMISSYNLIPDQFSIMGYDLTYDLFNILLHQGNFFENLTSNRRFGIANVFDYTQDQNGFIQNNGMFMLKYNGMMSQQIDLKFTEHHSISVDSLSASSIPDQPETELNPNSETEPPIEEQEENVFNIFDVF